MKRCHQCGDEWTRTEQPGFRETCPRCESWLHSCLNCRLYNPRSDRCSSITAECTGERQLLNYCEEFQFRDMPNNAGHRNGNGSGNGRGRVKDHGNRTSAREKFDKLFGGNP